MILNGGNLESIVKYAVAGGTLGMIPLCKQKQTTFKGSDESAIEFHDLYENKIISNEHHIFFGKQEINYSLIKESARIVNLLLVKYFKTGKQFPKDILIFLLNQGISNFSNIQRF